MRRQKIRVGIIGAGRIANLVHVPSLKLCSDMCFLSWAADTEVTVNLLRVECAESVLHIEPEIRGLEYHCNDRNEDDGQDYWSLYWHSRYYGADLIRYIVRQYGR